MGIARYIDYCGLAITVLPRKTTWTVQWDCTKTLSNITFARENGPLDLLVNCSEGSVMMQVFLYFGKGSSHFTSLNDQATEFAFC